MAKFKLMVTPFLILALINVSYGIDVGLNDALDLIKLGRETVVELMESWQMMRPRGLDEKNRRTKYLFMNRMERELRQQIDRISKKIDVYQERMEIKMDNILAQLLLQLELQHWLDDNLRELDHYVGQVNGLYNTFEMYSNNTDRYERYTMVQFAKSCVSPRLGELPDVLKSIHRLMVPSEQQVYNRSIFVLLANQMKVGLCTYKGLMRFAYNFSNFKMQ